MRFVEGQGGLGVFVRAGLVIPPSLVSSAVDAPLALLCVEADDCARDAGRVSAVEKDFCRSGLVWKACVRRDSLRPAREADNGGSLQYLS